MGSTGGRFYRKVGFGLRPDEDVPKDRLGWAVEQISGIPPLIWPGKIYSVDEMLDIRTSFLGAEQKLEQTITDPNQLRMKREALYKEKGRRFFGPYELAIRHHQAVLSDKAVFERFQHFWGNHFAIVDKIKLATFNTGAYQRQTIRNQMDKRFADLVMAATLSFPMMRSLDNFLSRGPNSKFSKRNKRKKKVNGLNENHGRELLELHTVSPTAGYSQKDVINAAYILTGWGMWDGKKRQEGKKVSFQGDVHEPGSHTVLGKVYKSKGFNEKAKGKNQLADLVEDLCSNPICIDFITEKLCRHFICDQPTKPMVDHVKAAWKANDGALPAIHIAVLEAADKYGDAHYKFQSPEIWLLQSARMLGGEWPGNPSLFEYNFREKPTGKMRKPARILLEIGHSPFRAKQPNGFPDDMASWLSPEYLVRRLTLAQSAKRIGLVDKKRPLKQTISAAVERNFESSIFWEDLLEGLGAGVDDRSLSVAFLCSKEVLRS